MIAERPRRSYSSSLRLLLLHLLSRVLSFDWLRPRTLFAWDRSSSGPASRTSWLDGLRGVASLQVFFFHFFGRYTRWTRSFGSTPEDRYIHQLPIFKSIWGGGSSAVCVFFIISGYAISVKSLTLLRQKNYDELYQRLSSSLIRRGFRLYLPVLLLAFPMLFVIRSIDMVRDGYVYDLELQDSWYMQFVHLANATDDHITPFMYPETNPTQNRYAYVPTSWTIPLEYYGSIVVYLLIMVVSRVEIFWTRHVILAGMATYALHRGSWWTSNFIVGMLLADYVLEQESRSTSIVRGYRNMKLVRNLCFIILFGCGFYLAGLPPASAPFEFDVKPKPGYEIFYKYYPSYWIVRMTDQTRWYWYWSGTFTVVSISQLPWIQSVLNTRFCQWLGKISFSLYLIHAAVLSALSTPLQNIITTVTGHKGVLCLLEFTIMTPLIVILSGVLERYIDRPSVKFAKRVESYLWRKQLVEKEEVHFISRDLEIQEH